MSHAFFFIIPEVQFLHYFGGSSTQQELIFMSNFLAKKLYYYSRCGFNSLKKISAWAWTLIGPKEGSKLNFSIICLAIPDLRKILGKSKNCFS